MRQENMARNNQSFSSAESFDLHTNRYRHRTSNKYPTAKSGKLLFQFLIRKVQETPETIKPIAVAFDFLPEQEGKIAENTPLQ